MHWLQVRLDRVSFYSKSFLCCSAALLSRFVVSQDENLLVHVAQGHRIPAGALDGHREEGQVSVVRASIARFGYVRAFTDLLSFAVSSPGHSSSLSPSWGTRCRYTFVESLHQTSLRIQLYHRRSPRIASHRRLLHTHTAVNHIYYLTHI